MKQRLASGTEPAVEPDPKTEPTAPPAQALTPERVLSLQRTAGNSIVARFLTVSRTTDDPPSTASTAGAAATAAVEATASDPAVDALDLKPKAKAAANSLKQAFPAISFTSGKREDVTDQARAMAGNVVSNRNWITETYADKTLAKQLQKWLDDNPDAKTKDAIAAGLTEVMSAWTEAEKGRLSAHFSGEAFDIQPQTDKADEIKAKANELATAGGGKFLEKEGGLIRWHFQLRE